MAGEPGRGSLGEMVFKLRLEGELGTSECGVWRPQEQSVQRSCGSNKLAPLRN